MNAVPDNVYICTKASENNSPVGLYANSKMNSFFACDVVNYVTTQSHHLDRSRTALTKQKVNPIMQKKFTSNGSSTLTASGEFTNLLMSPDGQAATQGQDRDRISLYNIIVSRQQEHSSLDGDDNNDGTGGGGLLADLGKFTVIAPNPYESAADGANKGVTRKTVNIKMLDILFDNQVCSLVYMTDLTQIIAESEECLNKEKLLQVSDISEQLQTPQETIILLLD